MVYGHNGSGKSTLSELLLSLTEEQCATDVIWESDDGEKVTVRAGGVSPSPSMAVFTRKWVKENLSAFLDGKSASAIVTLGREAITAKEEEERLGAQIEQLRDEASAAEDESGAAAQKVDELAREVQNRIVSELKEFDYNHFTKNRYSIPKVQDGMRGYAAEFPDVNSHAEALKRLGEGAPRPIPDIPAPPAEFAIPLAKMSALLAETPTRMAIAALEGSPPAQQWVEQGLELHEDLDNCLFCDSEIGRERRDRLARYFDESWLQLRARAQETLAAATCQMSALTAWRTALPNPVQLSGELRAAYEYARDQALADVAERLAALQAVKDALDSKIADPSVITDTPDWSAITPGLSITALKRSVDAHNDQAQRQEELTAERTKVVLDHLLGANSRAFRDLEEQSKNTALRSLACSRDAEIAERELEALRQTRFTTKDMADTLTRDLARVYGKDHLNIAITGDGKTYTCRRGDKPGTALSEGERTTLSLLYFLRNLEDEQIPGVDRGQRIVVIDDPSSSLDREALFATHQWLIDTLKDFGQYVILTHDFSLLRLFLKSHNNAWGKSLKNIEQGKADEIQFPKVAFLEMFTAVVDGERRTRLGNLPSLLLKSTSEYAYLFSMVMAGIADAEDHERLFLLPNAARRVLEVFASYKAPHRTDFRQQLEVLVDSGNGGAFRDVYDFCNRFSHGEGQESIEVLDARAVHGQIRRCMEFLRAVDNEHFVRMCAATGVDPVVLA